MPSLLSVSSDRRDSQRSGRRNCRSVARRHRKARCRVPGTRLVAPAIPKPAAIDLVDADCRVAGTGRC